MDINKAKNHFLRYYQRLSKLPLVSDDESARLFGEEVNTALAELESYNRRQQLCARCANRCCLLVDCELYTPGLSTCPIQAYRPLLCRLHFCSRFAEVYPLHVKQLGDIFLECVLALERRDQKKAKCCDSPPLSRFVPELVAAIGILLSDFKRGFIDETKVLRLIQAETEKC